ncbi:MAG: acetylglutamate kinase [Omnitrophica bacterium GWA2_41_15]|nr:MAG: acetylglutamate kinase [Omnitrophica bacterium GWA2_41_15]HAZ11129.1 acetylglutamate kinase [Candidatus Omnitrophota bacterium]
MEKAIKKADVLIEALPYIKSYSGKIFVIKYGGSALINPEIKKGVLQDIVFMSYVGIRPILVHGGGPFINEEFRKLGKKVKFTEGLRVTTKDDITVVDRVLSQVNEGIVNDIKKLGGRALGMNTTKKNIIKARPHKESKILGFVGEIDAVNVDTIRNAVRPRTIPVISPVSIGEDNELYNINADDASSEIAIALKAVKLVLLTDVKGIMRHKGDESSLISTLAMKDADTLIARKVIQSGMIPKVKACMNALRSGVSKTHIIDGRIPHSLLLEIFTDKGIGTEILKDK